MNWTTLTNPRWWLGLPVVLATGAIVLPFWLASAVCYRLHRATFVTYRNVENRLHPVVLSIMRWSRSTSKDTP